MAKNNDVATPVPIEGRLQLRAGPTGSFPALEFDDVPVDVWSVPDDRYSFLAGNDGPVSNVWVHAADARTFAPYPLQPTGTGTAPTSQLDSRIQIVFPHDASGNPTSVEQAMYVNVAVDIFLHGTTLSVPVDFQPDILNLDEAVGNGPLGQQERVDAKKTTYRLRDLTYPRWVFNDVPLEPKQVYHFAAFVYKGKIRSPYSTIWTHAADARTFEPAPTVPPACVP